MINSKHITYNLKENHIIDDIGILLWPRNSPKKDILEHFITVSKKISGKKPIFFIDDLCSQIVCNRTVCEQKNYNNEYAEFFNSKSIEFYLSSDLVDIININYQFFSKEWSKLKTSTYLSLLPKKKLIDNEIFLSEFAHTILQELFLREALKKTSTMLLGKFSQNSLFLHKILTNENINTIILERYTNEKK